MMPTALLPKLPSLFFESMRAQMLNTMHLLVENRGRDTTEGLNRRSQFCRIG
jgi:hypothetical protein